MKVYLVWEMVSDQYGTSKIAHVAATEELAKTLAAKVASEKRTMTNVEGVEVEGASVPALPNALRGRAFNITWGPDHGRPAGYYVSIPNYNGGEVVPLADVEELLRQHLVLPREGELRGPVMETTIFHTDTHLKPEQVLPPGSPGSIRRY